MVATEQIAPTEQRDAQAAFERARDHVRDLQAAIADLPSAYAAAVKAGDAPAMKAARYRRVDLEEELTIAHIQLVHAELAALDADAAGLGAREGEAARAVQETFARTQIAKAALEAALAESNAAQNVAAALRAARDDIAARRWDLRERLKQLTATALPE